jgi:hypothetical protein
MATAYPSIARTDYAADDSVTTDTLGGLIDIAECIIRKPIGLYFSGLSHNTTSFVDVVEWYQYNPGYYTGRYLLLTIEAYVSAGTGNWRVIDKGDADTVISDVIAVTATGSYADSGPATITVPSDWSAESLRLLAIQAQAPSAETIYLNCADKLEYYCTD